MSFYKTAESIVSKQDETIVLSLGSHEGLTSLHQRTGEALKDIEKTDGALIFDGHARRDALQRLPSVLQQR